MRITARRNSRSFAASLENSLPQNSVSLPPFLRRTAHRFPASLCICPSHGLPILKIPLKIGPLCFMPASDRGPPGKTERLSAASLRILSGTASAQSSQKAALFPTPKTTAAAVCARLLPNSAASLSLSLRRVHSGKFSLRRAVQGEKFPGIFLCRRKTKVILFYFYRSVGACARFFSAFSQLSARISRAAISSPSMAVPLLRRFAETVPADIRRPACFPLKRQYAHISSARRKIGTRKTRLMMRRVSYFLSSRISREPP